MNKRSVRRTWSRSPAVALALATVLLAPPALAAGSAEGARLDLTRHWVGITALVAFVLAYLAVMAEEFTHMRKSKPVVLVAGILWLLIAVVYQMEGAPGIPHEAIRHNLLEYAELFLFLLVAMTYINALTERQVFDWLQTWLVGRGLSLRQLFWITGGIAFFLSPVADNLTTALFMCAVIMAVGAGQPRFIGLGCINVVVAANAGGAFSPFGDITTLMVWQRGLVDFLEFFDLFLPAAVSYLIPAAVMHFAVPRLQPRAGGESVQILRGGLFIVLLFIATIVTAVFFHNFLNLPPVVGMMTGLAYLQLYGYYLKRTHRTGDPRDGDTSHDPEHLDEVVSFDIFRKVGRAEWDTLLFFYGVIMSVGALSLIGYLELASGYFYGELGPLTANVLVGILSAIVDNIPVMFAVLTMLPDMSHGHWLLVTLTAGIGGSMLSIGSAAGVALMGQARGYYTFFGHLRWAPIIAVGYAAGIAVHMWLNAELF